MSKHEQEKLSNVTPDSVAFELFTIIVRLEKKQFEPGFPESADRQWVLDTYSECIEAAQGKRRPAA